MWQSPLVMNRLIYCQKKLASKMGVLSTLRSFMSSELLQKNFNTVVFWHLYYCSTLWGNMKNKTSTSYMHFQSEPLGCLKQIIVFIYSRNDKATELDASCRWLWVQNNHPCFSSLTWFISKIIRHYKICKWNRQNINQIKPK